MLYRDKLENWSPKIDGDTGKHHFFCRHKLLFLTTKIENRRFMEEIARKQPLHICLFYGLFSLDITLI